MKNNRSRNIIVFVCLAALLTFLIIQYGSKPEYSWAENYEVTNEGPYGTSVIKTLLDDFIPGEKLLLLEDSIMQLTDYEQDSVANYLFIGASQYIDSLDAELLFDFVDRGNNAFLISRSLPEDLAYYLYYYDCNDDQEWEGYDVLQDSLVAMNLSHQAFSQEEGTRFLYEYKGRRRNYDWQYIPNDFICDAALGFVRLGTFNNDYSNFVRVPYGNGHFYLHTNPMVFTNISMLEEDRLAYVSSVFSHLQEGPIYWDEASKLAGYLPDPRSNRSLSEKTPFDFILSQPALAWAWYLVLVMTLCYLLFRTKRRQRIIPVLEKNQNTSLEFLQTMGNLYFLQNDHRKIALHKMRLFLGFIRDRYYLSTQDLDQPFVEQLSQKSEIPIKDIEAILLLYKNINSSSFVSEKILIDFHKKIERFYKNCK